MVCIFITELHIVVVNAFIVHVRNYSTLRLHLHATLKTMVKSLSVENVGEYVGLLK